MFIDIYLSFAHNHSIKIYDLFFLSFILSLCTTIRPKISVLIIFFFYLYMTIRPKLGVTLILKVVISLIKPIFCLQYCLYISSATIIPLYFVYYIHRSAALIFRTLYPWLFEALAKKSFRHRCLLLNSAKFLITFFRRTLWTTAPAQTLVLFTVPPWPYAFSKTISNIFSSWVYFSVYFVRWEQEWAQYFQPLARSLFSTQSNICDGPFLRK